MRQPHPQDDSARRALAVQRALRAAAAVTTTALFSLSPAGCAVTVAPADDAPRDADTAADAAPSVDVGVDADTPAVHDAPAHPPADAHTVALHDAGAATDGPVDACAACEGLLGPGAWPACTPEYTACLAEAAAERDAPCAWACAAWGPFVPPGMEA